MFQATRFPSPQNDILVNQSGDAFCCICFKSPCSSELVLNKPHLVKTKARKPGFLVSYHQGPDRNSPEVIQLANVTADGQDAVPTSRAFAHLKTPTAVTCAQDFSFRWLLQGFFFSSCF